MTGEHRFHLRLVRNEPEVPSTLEGNTLTSEEIPQPEARKDEDHDWAVITAELPVLRANLEKKQPPDELAKAIEAVYKKVDELEVIANGQFIEKPNQFAKGGVLRQEQLSCDEQVLGPLIDEMVALKGSLPQAVKSYREAYFTSYGFFGGDAKQELLPSEYLTSHKIDYIISISTRTFRNLSYGVEAPYSQPKDIQREYVANTIRLYMDWAKRSAELKSKMGHDDYNLKEGLGGLLQRIALISDRNTDAYYFILDHYEELDDREKNICILNMRSYNSGEDGNALKASFEKRVRQHHEMKKLGELLSQAKSIQELLYFIDTHVETITVERSFKLCSDYSKEYLKDHIAEIVEKFDYEKEINEKGIDGTLADQTLKKARQAEETLSGEAEHPLTRHVGKFNLRKFVYEKMLERLKIGFDIIAEKNRLRRLDECADWVDLIWYANRTIEDGKIYKVAVDRPDGVHEIKTFSGLKLKEYVKEIPYTDRDLKKLPIAEEVDMDKSPDGKFITGLRKQAEFLLAA